MDDFASTALYNLVAKSMAAAGATASPADTFEGKLARSRKSGLLADALSRLGAGFVVGIGQSIRGITGEPTLEVLLRAKDPADLLQRWLRLERYYHGKHRIRLLASSADSLVLEHYSTVSRPPSAGEDLLIAGLLAALLQRIGCCELSLQIGEPPVSLIALDSVVEDVRVSADTGVWAITWRRFEAVPDAPAVSITALSASDRLSQALAQDIGRSWRLADAATELGMSKRSLQRALATEGTSFQRLLREVRVHSAGALVASGTHSLSQAGYACGFSDQAHFSREFKLRFNMSPAEYAQWAVI